MADKERPWWQDRRAPPEGQQPPRQPPRPRMKPRQPPEGENTGGQQWWQDKRVPKQWQDQSEPQQQRPQRPPQRQGQGSADAYEGAPPDEQSRMLRGAYQAGINGDDGAMQSFPNTPFGQRLRQEFMKGRQQRGTPGRGLGFSQMDRS